MGVLTFFARRFVAGETAADAVSAAERTRPRHIRAILDFLGEHVNTAEEAHVAVAEYLNLLEKIHERGIDAEVSLKASQMGIMISPEECLKNLLIVAERAATYGITVWMDMEESALTQKTIEVFEQLRARKPNVGICLQAYLVRTGADLERLMRQPLNIRLCKGAYKEPPTIAYGNRRAVDASYRMLATKLLENIPRGVYPAFATHDRMIIYDILRQVKEKGLDAKRFEFEMLYGIENNYLESLAAQGYGAKVYVPYGRNWLPYFTRRLKERKENIYFVLRNLFRM
jgi:proline dehydrogenase